MAFPYVFGDSVTAGEGGGGGEAVPPEVTLVSPSQLNALSRNEPIVLEVTDETQLARVLITVQYPSLDAPQVAFDGTGFTEPFATESSTEDITDGYRFTLRRRTGWPSRQLTLKVYAVDTSGNESA
jgi:hypothetical protein